MAATPPPRHVTHSPRQQPEQQPGQDYEVQTGYPAGKLGSRSTVTPARTTTRTGTITQIVHRVPLNLRLKSLECKTKLMQGPEAYPDYCCPLVSKTHFTAAGPILKCINTQIPGIPEEVSSLRLPYLHTESIPKFFYQNMGNVKKWAVDEIVKISKDNCCNFANHSKIGIEHWTSKVALQTLHPKVKEAMNVREAGVWVCHYPNMLEPIKGRDYEDGTSETFHVIHVYVQLLPISLRLHTPDGGWDAKPPQIFRGDGPSEKRPRFPQAQRYPQQSDQAAMTIIEENKKVLEDVKKSLLSRQQPPFPDLPQSSVEPGGTTPWVPPESDGPKFI